MLLKTRKTSSTQINHLFLSSYLITFIFISYSFNPFSLFIAHFAICFGVWRWGNKLWSIALWLVGPWFLQNTQNFREIFPPLPLNVCKSFLLLITDSTTIVMATLSITLLIMASVSYQCIFEIFMIYFIIIYITLSWLIIFYGVFF